MANLLSGSKRYPSLYQILLLEKVWCSLRCRKLLVVHFHLILPLHMGQWSTVQFIPELTPLRHEFIHQVHKPMVVGRLQ